MMQTIYCIPGLGADENVFQFLDLSFAKPVFINWISPLKDETMAEYAIRVKEQFIHDESPVIFGLSLGGMVAVELAKAIPSAKVIIISSAKTKNEIPYYWKVFQYLPLHKILPDWSIRKHSVMREYFLGARNEPAKSYVKQVAKQADGDFYRWAIGAILNWQNQVIPKNVTHIHGNADKLLPYKFIQPDISVINGGHLMIMENAEVISGLLKQIYLN